MSLRFTLSVTVCVAALAAASFLAGRAVSDEPPKGLPPEMEEMMKQWEKMKNPGPQHELLKGMEGAWIGTGTWTEAGMTSKFREEVTAKLVFGGRFLRSGSKMTTEATPEFPAMSMESLSFLGFDNAKEKYVFAMLGDMSTALGSAEGTYDAVAKTLTVTGTEVQAPGKERKFRMVQRFASADEWIFEFYFTQDGVESKAGEGVYKRQAPPAAAGTNPCPPGHGTAK